MHIDFVIPVNRNLVAGYEAYEKKSRNSCMDYGFHMAITKWDDGVSKDMEIMVKEKGDIWKAVCRNHVCRTSRKLWCKVLKSPYGHNNLAIKDTKTFVLLFLII